MKCILLLALAGLGSLGLSSCKKKDITYTVEGVVTDDSYAQPLAGATVGLYEIPAGSASAATLLSSVTTGSDGKYHFEFKREKIQEYIIKVSKTNYFPLSMGFSADDLDPKNTNTFSHHVTAKAWVKLHFVNTDPDQDLKYIRQNGKTGCDECCAATEQLLYGVTDVSIYCINDGNTTYGYYYWVLNTPDNGPKSVVTPPFDTTEILLNY